MLSRGVGRLLIVATVGWIGFASAAAMVLGTSVYESPPSALSLPPPGFEPIFSGAQIWERDVTGLPALVVWVMQQDGWETLLIPPALLFVVTGALARIVGGFRPK